MRGWNKNRSKIITMVHIPADYLFTASVWGFYELLKLRLRTKPDPLVMRSRLQHLSALQLVCEHGCLDLNELLLDRGWGLETNDSYLLLGIAISDERRSVIAKSHHRK